MNFTQAQQYIYILSRQQMDNTREFYLRLPRFLLFPFGWRMPHRILHTE